MSVTKCLFLLANLSLVFSIPKRNLNLEQKLSLTNGASFPVTYKGVSDECTSNNEVVVDADELYIVASKPDAIAYTCIHKFRANGVMELEIFCDRFAMRLSCFTESFKVVIDGTSQTLCNGNLGPNKHGKSINIVYTRKVSSFYGGYMCYIKSKSSDDSSGAETGVPSTTEPTSQIPFGSTETSLTPTQASGNQTSEQITDTFDYCRICGRDSALGTRIVGGKDSEKEYPWMSVLIITLSNGNAICGGSLIASNLILTAAHCVEGGVKSIKVLLGKRNLENPEEKGSLVLKAESFDVHSGYDSDRVINDIAVVHIPKVKFTNYIKPLCLPPNGSGSFKKEKGKALGYGLTSKGKNADLATILQEVDLEILTEKECSYKWRRYGVKILKSHLCALDEGKSTCRGDSGGPLMVKVNGQWIIVGLTSFGFATCAHQGTPSVFTRVSEFRSWITPFFTDASCK